MKHLVWILAGMLAGLALPVAAADDGPGSAPLAFGVVPQQSARTLAGNWAPLLASVGEASGTPLRFRTAKDIPEFERRLAAGEYDLAYMNPYHYTVFSQRPGYRAFAKARDKQIKGILVVPKDSPIAHPRELAGQQLAFPAPAAFAASILTRAYLAGEGIAFTPHYVASHDSVYRTVAKGLYGAGGGVMRTFNSMEPEVRDRLRVLWTSEGNTPHAFAAHPRVPAEALERIIAAMVALDRTESGAALLGPLRIVGIETAEDADWDDVRGLGIDLLDALAQPVP